MHRQPYSLPSVPQPRLDHCRPGAGAVVLHPDHPLAYYEFRDHLATDLSAGVVGQTPGHLMQRAVTCAGVDAARAGEWTERFWNDLKRGIERRRERR